MRDNIPLQRQNRVGVCAGCGEEEVLVKHHWYEWEELQKFAKGELPKEKLKHTKMVCENCNSLSALRSNGSHILPSWEKQLAMIKEYQESAFGQYEKELKLYNEGKLPYDADEFNKYGVIG